MIDNIEIDNYGVIKTINEIDEGHKIMKMLGGCGCINISCM